MSNRALFVIIFALLAAGRAPAQVTHPDGRGPVAGWEGRVQLSSEGIQVPGPQVLALPDGGPWQPNWIWAQAAEGTPAAQFRKVLTLPQGSNIRTAVARISADRTYRFWVNGRLVSRGPDDPGSDVILSQNWSHQWLYNQVDLAPYLHAGDNILAAEVLTLNSPSYSLKHPGFAFDLTTVSTLGAKQHVQSDASWAAQPLFAYGLGPILHGSIVQPGGKPPETGLLYDARLDSPFWKAPSFDQRWLPAVMVAPVWGTLAASRIPQAMETVYPAETIARIAGPVTLIKAAHGKLDSVLLDGSGSFSVDYDRVLSAYASFRVHGPAGTVVTIQTAETKTNSSPRRSAQITLAEGVTVFEQPVYDAFSTIRITISKTGGPVEFSDLRATFTSQPVAYRGSFTTSDDDLNRLWKAARWSTQICMQNHYLDSPNHQEPIGDFGDYLIEALENDYAFNAQALTRQDLKKFSLLLEQSGSVNFHTSYSLLWLQMLLDYYDWSGDREFVIELKPTADRLLDHFASFVGRNGILSEAPNYMFMDWVTIGGFATHHPPAVIGQGYLSAFYYRALDDGARIASLARDDVRQEKYRSLRTQLKAAFEAELWDDQAGLYRDGKPHQNHQPIGRWLPEDKDIETHSTQVNALAVLYDLAPRERQSALMDRLNAQPKLNVQPYFMQFVFAAEVHAGTFNSVALRQLHWWQINAETQTFSENFGGGDFSHAWGGTPLIQMSSQILGVSNVLAGGTSVRIEPLTAGLEFARGVVPTVAGDVQVSWSVSESEFSLQLTLPPQTGAEVILPGSKDPGAEIWLDGQRHFQGPVAITGGTHRIAVHSAQKK